MVAEDSQNDSRAGAHDGKGWESQVCSGLKRRQLWVDLTGVFNYVMGGWSPTLLGSTAAGQEAADRLEHGKFQLNIGNNIFSLW